VAAGSPLTPRPAALFESFLPGREGRSFRFDGLEQVLVATTPAAVLPLFAAIERAVAGGRHAAGFVSYEAAPGFDPALPTRPQGELPLACFGLFRARTPTEAGSSEIAGPCRLLEPRPSWNPADYAAAFAAAREYITAGDSYQINLTLRQQFRFAGDPFTLYRQLCISQPAAFCAWLEFGGLAVASASPELFFARHGGEVVMRPMKGTAPRGDEEATDRRLRAWLASSPKERAENLMIVDLVRSDLGRIAQTGAVAVPELFAVESYPTLHQMTSTVTARLREGVSLADLFRALFPCGSVTGAPKRRSMAIIEELETSPRGLYCGAIGFVSPGDEAVFSVAIRTAVLDPHRGTGELGIGSGITADAEVAEEYRECLGKAAFLARHAEPLQLVETFGWEAGYGCLLLERHLQRLAASAKALGFACDLPALRRRLRAVRPGGAGPHKIRLLLARDGTATLTTTPLLRPGPAQSPARVGLATAGIDSSEPLLRHKTTWRPWYDGVLERHSGCLDVLFYNERDEVTEGTIHNLVVERAGRLITPPVTCGLLPGTLREELLAQGVLTEELVKRGELFAARRLWLINSARGWRRVVLDSSAGETDLAS
jgi:para-aminobenzoate synthetase/4-amino-4-deoxychorismate lyase